MLDFRKPFELRVGKGGESYFVQDGRKYTLSGYPLPADQESQPLDAVPTTADLKVAFKALEVKSDEPSQPKRARGRKPRTDGSE